MNLEKAIRKNIEPLVHMSLATVKENKPWVCEVHFVYDDDLNLYFRSLISRRHSQEIAQNPHVAGNIVRQYNLGDNVTGIYFEGSARKLDQGDEWDKAFNYFKERLHLPDTARNEAKSEDGHQFYKIVVDSFYLFGRLGDAPAQKHKLIWNGGKK